MSKSYSDKLKDPRWQRKRLEILSRDNFTCTLCGDEKTELHVHHEKYGKEPWDVDSEFLRTLCKQCHIAVEDEIKMCDPLNINLRNKALKISSNEINYHLLAFRTISGGYSIRIIYNDLIELCFQLTDSSTLKLIEFFQNGQKIH